MRRFFTFGKFNTWYDWRCTLTAKTIPEAEPKYNYILLDGVHGTLDATEALTGEVAYSDRTLSASFMCSEGTYAEREALLRSIVASLHGRKVQIIEPDDQEHYFLGRVKVTGVAKFQTYMTFTLEATCDPWRYAIEETHRLVEVSSGIEPAAAPVMMYSTRAAGADAVIASGTFGAQGDNLTWELYDTGELNISGHGAMGNSWTAASDKRPPWEPYKEQITALVIEPGVVEVGKYAFYSFKSLASVSLPATVTVIGGGAFYNCSALRAVHLPASVAEIASGYAFGSGVGMDLVFLGNAPSVAPANNTQGAPSFKNVTLYYTPGTTGWIDSDAYDAEAGTWNGYTLQELTCTHPSTTTYNVPNGDGTHTTTNICDVCGEVAFTSTVACTDGNNDNKCDICSGVMGCTHDVTTVNYDYNRNKTHTTKTVCLYCGEELSRVVEDCSDADGDGLCDSCGGDITIIIPSEVDVVLNNTGVKTLCPELYVEGSILLTFGGASVELETGAYKVADLKLRQGDNLVHVTGDGSIEFVYREATL